VPLPLAPSTRRAALAASLLWPLLAACGADPAAPGAPAPEMTVSVGDSTVAPPAPLPPTTIETHEVGVLLHDGDESVRAIARDLLREHAPDAGARVDSIRAHETLRMFTVPLTDAEESRLLTDPRVAEAGTLPPASIESAPGAWWTGAGAAGRLGASAPRLGGLLAGAGWAGAGWAVDRLDQRALPLDASFSPGARGQGVRVYILDTGVRATHQDYAGRVLPGWDATTGTPANGTDCHGHGTFVASNAAGALYGVAHDARVVDVRVLGCSGSGYLSHIFSGLEWVLQQKQANPDVPMVANMSLGSGASSVFDAVVAKVTAGGVTVVVAAGNNNGDACSKSPARAPTAITVGATDVSDHRAGFSNWGRCVDVFAPGASIQGASAGSDAGMGYMSGTSMASPLAAGIAAAYLELYPTALPEQVHEAVIASSTEGVVQNAGTGSPNRLAFVGSLGMLPQPGVLVADAGVSCVRRSCTFEGGVSRGAVRSYAWDLGGGIAPTTIRAQRTFPTNGRFPVGLTVRDAQGRASTWRDTITVTDRAPTAGLAVSCTATRVCTFTPAGSSDDGRLAKYAWTFGDGSTLTTSATTARRTIAAYGSYTARLTVTDDVGQTATATRAYSIQPPVPTVGFAVSCSSGRTCSFNASASSAVDGIAAYRWEFGNSKVGLGVRTTHQYTAAGTYLVRLTITTRSGITAQRTLQLVLR
jgi:subtilisin family serine protease